MKSNIFEMSKNVAETQFFFDKPTHFNYQVTRDARMFERQIATRASHNHSKQLCTSKNVLQ